MENSDNPVIFWFRQDLRLSDSPGLEAAAAEGAGIIPCFILDDDAAGDWGPGGAGRWWLYHSLQALQSSLADRGSGLVVRRGKTADELVRLARETGATRVVCTRAYEPWNRDLGQAVSDRLAAEDIELILCGGRLLHEPAEVLNQSGQPFKVFTPYWKHCLKRPDPASPLQAPGKNSFARNLPEGLAPEDWNLPADSPEREWQQHWSPGEEGANERLQAFVRQDLDDYAEGRDRPALETTSRLSPHLHWGEVSPRQVWQAITMSGNDADGKYLSELGWREFSHYLLYHFPHTVDRPFKERFSDFPWLGKEAHFEAWKHGRTGYPIVDAGMRELWHTGFMHNRVRMICASFLTKHLLLPWQWGARWFWEQLLDADLANNTCGWQWVAGCGADAAPYFRIFNPTLQGEKFDKAGEYVRRWVPELAPLPDSHIHSPWTLSSGKLEELGVKLGDTYPAPMVDHKEAREAALSAWKLTDPERQAQPTLPGIDN